MPKYRDYVRKMFKEHEDEFAEFAQIHTLYEQNQQKYQDEFNKIGAPIQKIIKDYEQKLCGHSEKGKYAQFSTKLAEKFHKEIKAFFPYVDFIGIKVSGPKLDLDTKKASKKTEKKEPVDPDIAEIDAIDTSDFSIPKLF